MSYCRLHNNRLIRAARGNTNRPYSGHVPTSRTSAKARGLTTQQWLPFNEAREYVRKLELKTQKEWKAWRASPQRPR